MSGQTAHEAVVVALVFRWAEGEVTVAEPHRWSRPEEAQALCGLAFHAGQMEAHAAALEDALLGEEAAKQKAQRTLFESFDSWGADLHEDEDCPGDDTCECERAARFEAALGGWRP